ncbi:MAG: DNA-binding response regulator [Clostridiales bacterium]|nr:DNA-binding response regulator [Clostridiales bacterium]
METVIVISNYILRRGLKAILSEEKDIQVVGEGTNVKKGVEIILKQNPSIALVDLKLGDEDGLRIIEEVRKENLKCKFIVLTDSTDYRDLKRVRDYNVEGYILKEALSEEIIYAVRIIQAGKKYYDASLMLNTMSPKKTEYIESEALDKLTQRELEVLIALAGGLSNIDIAKKLLITEYTVKKHVSNILSKLNLNDRTQAALYASAHGLIS